MAFQTVLPSEKPVAHVPMAEWNARVARLRNVADVRRSDAFALRHSARTVRNETRIESDWANYDTNEALTDRIEQLNSWRDIIGKTFERIQEEIKNLEHEKALTEYELDSLSLPLSVMCEVLAIRDGRLGSEITCDEPGKELKNELNVLESNQRWLTERCQNAWEKLLRLEEVRYKIGMEIANKVEAVDLDNVQLALVRESTTLSYKPDPLRNPKNSCSYEVWLAHVKNMKQLAENELVDTSAVREGLFVAREKARNMLKAQQDKTEHAVRKRVFETQRARNELEWQKLKMKEELEMVESEIRNLEDALKDKSLSLMLAETRLENRAQRSGMELCMDQAHDSLCLEVEKMREIRRSLKAKIDDAKANFNQLTDHADKINFDLECKQHSLMMDIRVLDVRGRLKESGDRGITLTLMESEIPKA